MSHLMWLSSALLFISSVSMAENIAPETPSKEDVELSNTAATIDQQVVLRVIQSCSSNEGLKVQLRKKCFSDYFQKFSKESHLNKTHFKVVFMDILGTNCPDVEEAKNKTMCKTVSQEIHALVFNLNRPKRTAHIIYELDKPGADSLQWTEKRTYMKTEDSDADLSKEQFYNFSIN